MNFFRKGLEDSITLPPHPSSKGEIQEVRDAMNKRTAKDVESARNHDRVPFYAIKKYCEDNGLIFHDDEFEDIIYQATPVINHFKKQFNRSIYLLDSDILFVYSHHSYFISEFMLEYFSS